MIQVGRILLIFLMLCAPVQAATLYVDNSGTCSDSNTRAQNIAGAGTSSLWCSLGRAAWGSTDRSSMNSYEAAQAGDTVIVAAGTYTMSGLTNWQTDTKYSPVFEGPNSGSSGNPITFQAEYPASYSGGNYTVIQTEVLDGSQTTGQPTIGNNNRSYIVWDGFYIDVDDADIHSDTGPVVAWGTSNITFKNLYIVGVPVPYGGYDDNNNAIRIEASSDVTVENCYLTDFTANHGSGVTIYSGTDVVLQNNEVNNCENGLFAKDMVQGQITVRYNYVHDSTKALRFTQIFTVGADVYQNLLIDNSIGVELAVAAVNGPDYIDVVNNTIIGSTSSSDGGLKLSDSLNMADNNRFWNNIVVNSTLAGMRTYGDYAHGAFTSGYNCVYNNTTDFRHNTTNYTLASWQSTFSKETGSSTVNPQFVGGGDYSLAVGSTLIEGRANDGVDILDLDGDSSTADAITLGAYITGNEIIGIDSGEAEPETAIQSSGLGLNGASMGGN